LTFVIISWPKRAEGRPGVVCAKGAGTGIKEQEKYIALKNEAIFQMEDFNLFGPDWQLTIARKNLEVLTYG
jgi:hypothetical protein